MEILEILSAYKTVALVGLSADSSTQSYKVASYLKSNGYKIIPVNPAAYDILDEKSYGSVGETKGAEIVCIFNQEEAEAAVNQAIAKKAKVVWMELGIKNEGAAEKAREAGLDVVMDKSIMIEHKRFKELELIEKAKTFVVPIITEQENMPELLERLKECTKLVLIFVVDKSVLNYVPTGFAGSRINIAQEVMEDIRSRLPQNIIVKDFIEWGDWYDKIENIARLENADEIIMKKSRMSDEFSSKLREKGLKVTVI